MRILVGGGQLAHKGQALLNAALSLHPVEGIAIGLTPANKAAKAVAVATALAREPRAPSVCKQINPLHPNGVVIHRHLTAEPMAM